MERDDCAEKDGQPTLSYNAISWFSSTAEAQSQVSKYGLCWEFVLFCAPLYMNVTLSSVCVALCLVLSEPDHIRYYRTISVGDVEGEGAHLSACHLPTCQGPSRYILHFDAS